MNLNESVVLNDIKKSLNEANEGNDLQELEKNLSEKLGFPVKYNMREGKTISFSFGPNKEFEEKIRSMKFDEKGKYTKDVINYLGDKVEDFYVVCNKDFCFAYVEVTPDFVDGIDRYDVNSLLDDPEKAKSELKFDELKEKINNLIGIDVDPEFSLEERKGGVRINITSKELIEEVGIMKKVFSSVTVDFSGSKVKANNKDGSLEAFGHIVISWDGRDGGFNNNPVGTAIFKDGKWEIERNN